MKIGYARVSTPDQNLDTQIEALHKAGCEKIYSEKTSASQRKSRLMEKNQPELAAALKALRPGDTFVVWALDRLGRSTVRLMRMIEELKDKKIHFEIITQKVDTSTLMGQAFLLFIAMFAENEKIVNSERTKAGLDGARARGVSLGGKPKLSKEKIQLMYELYKNRQTQSVPEIARTFGVCTRTLYNYVNPLIEEDKAKQASLFPELDEISKRVFGEFVLDKSDFPHS